MGLRQLRQHASELVRRVQAGEEFVVTVTGRPAALLTPTRPARWRSGSEIADIFQAPVDAVAWRTDRDGIRELLDDEPHDPWRSST